MIRVTTACLAVCLLAAPAVAADAKIEAAIKTIEKTAADPEKVKSYCAMTKVMESVGDDEKKAAAAEAEIDGYMKKLGPEFESAWSAGESLDENSPDAKALNAALEKLDDKCS